MKIFWTQNQNPNVPSTIIVDGVMDSFKDLPEQNMAMTKFNELRSWGCDPAVSENRGDNKKFKNWFSLSIRQNEGIFIRSCFKTKDDAGRLMPYMYYSSSPLIEEAIEDLKKYSSMVQKELDIEEIVSGYDEILKYPKKKMMNRGLLIIIGLIASCLLYLLGGNKHSSNSNSNQEVKDTVSHTK